MVFTSKCDIEGCTSWARDNTYKCKKHGGGRRCSEIGCKSSAIEGYVYDKCKRHGGGSRCSEIGCKSSTENRADKCIRHGGGVRCSEIGCKSSSRAPGDKCKRHGGGRRCIEVGCNTASRMSSDKCIRHGGGSRCPNCIDWVDSRGSHPDYDGYCTTCFKNVFPTDPRSLKIYSHSKEIKVRNMINEGFDGFIHDTPIYTNACNCTHRRRIDHRKLIGNTILAIETDEFAHRGYDPHDEEIRYDDLYMIHSGKWIFIRFNPDPNRENVKTTFEEKLENLSMAINYHICRIECEENVELLEIHTMYC
mgnify:CR=1 FL=1